MGSRNTNLANGILQLALGGFFIVLGLAGIIPTIDEGPFGIAFNYNWLEILFGIIEIGAGAIIILGFFILKDSRLSFWGAIIALILWVLRAFLASYKYIRSRRPFLEWIMILGIFVIVGLSLFTIIGHND